MSGNRPAIGVQGNRGDPAATTDDGNFSRQSLFKRLLQKFTAQFPAALTGGGNLKVAVQEALPAGANTVGKVDQGAPNGGAAQAWHVQDADVEAQLRIINALTPVAYDYIELGYTGADLTSVVYKSGGSGGTVVSTLTLGYTSGVLTSVART